MSAELKAPTFTERLAIIASAVALLLIVMLLGGCASQPASPGTPRVHQGSYASPAAPSLGRTTHAESATITIIYQRPEARDYVHP